MSEQLAVVLDRVAELVARGPCVRAAAKDRDGHTVPISASTAVCWCPVGALMKVTRGIAWGNSLYIDVYEALTSMAQAAGYTSVESFADNRPHTEVLAAVRQLAQDVRTLGTAFEQPRTFEGATS
jgi:hypothetical protein